MLTEKDLKEMELQTPKYDFVEPKDGEPVLSPIKRIIAKVQETASTFSLYNVYQALGHIDRQISETEDSLAKLKTNKDLFLAEIALVEKALGIQGMEEAYQKEVVAETAVAEALKASKTEEVS